MKTLIRFLAAATLLVAAIILVNCADPLEPQGLVSPENPRDTVRLHDTIVRTDTVIDQDTIIGNDTVIQTDTIIQIDTIFGADTVIVVDTFNQIDTVVQFDTIVQTDTVVRPDTIVVIDTLNQTDTVVVLDTVVVIDTVIVTPPDTCRPLQFCAQLSAALKEIVWMLQNQAGRYRLEFAATVVQGHPPKTLLLTINDQVYTWLPGTEPSLVLELNLPRNTVISIKPDKPMANGHEVNICLKPTRL